jgi:hypothetical protein
MKINFENLEKICREFSKNFWREKESKGEIAGDILIAGLALDIATKVGYYLYTLECNLYKDLYGGISHLIDFIK